MKWPWRYVIYGDIAVTLVTTFAYASWGRDVPGNFCQRDVDHDVPGKSKGSGGDSFRQLLPLRTQSLLPRVVWVVRPRQLLPRVVGVVRLQATFAFATKIMTVPAKAKEAKEATVAVVA